MCWCPVAVELVLEPSPHLLLNACITSSCVAAAGLVLLTAPITAEAWLCVDSVELADASLSARGRLVGGSGLVFAPGLGALAGAWGGWACTLHGNEEADETAE